MNMRNGAGLREVVAAIGRRMGLWGVIGVALALGGCSMLSFGSGSVDTFDLSAATRVKASHATGAQILVPEPVALKSLDTERIVVRPSPAEINYFSGAQWSDRLPRLVQSRLIETFENSGKARAGRPGQGLQIDYQVVTAIRAFEYDASQRKAHVEISAKLMNDHTGKVVAEDVFLAEIDCANDTAAAVTAALRTGLDRELQSIVGWTLKRI
ncbi:MAG: ABC-type transport auxiliary lipoprotein family protein [Ancalomicrobiaceae bacterium]|nr:ABC-type transport auxiliary lipoprotein family protein [Ancalomicrobiaceae bacterium]